MSPRARRRTAVSSMSLPLSTLLAACGQAPREGASAAPLDSTAMVARVDAFSGPEAVRYDPDQDVYFVSNFNGDPEALTNKGFISRLRPDGTVEQLRFIAGG